MALQKVKIILKGGKGSGDFGHTGRAGKRGGSGGGGGKGKPRRGRRSREALDKEIETNKRKEKGVFIKGDPVSFLFQNRRQTGTYESKSTFSDDRVNILDQDGDKFSVDKDSLNHISGSKKKPKPKPEPKKVDEPKIKVEPGAELPDGIVLRKKPPVKGGAYFITKDGLVVDLSRATGNSNTHPGALAHNQDNENFSNALGLSDNDKSRITTALRDGDGIAATKPALEGGTIRVNQTENGSVVIQTDKVDKKTLRKLQKLYDKGLLNFKPGASNFWEDGDLKSDTSFTFAEFLDAKFVTGSGRNIRLKESEDNYDFKHLIDVLT